MVPLSNYHAQSYFQRLARFTKEMILVWKHPKPSQTIPSVQKWTFRVCCLAIGISVSASAQNSQIRVDDSRHWTDPVTGLTVVTGSFEAPGGIDWSLQPDAQSSGSLRDIQLDADPEDAKKIEALNSGRRFQKIEIQKQLDQRSGELRSVYYQAIYYARDHDGSSPCKPEDLFGDEGEYPTWLREDTIHLIPNIPMELGDNNWPAPTDPQMLAIETRPFINDGKHWILLNNGRTQRREIDPELVAEYNLEIQPLFPETTLDARLEKILEKQDDATWILRALYPGDRLNANEKWTGIMASPERGAHVELTWNIPGATEMKSEQGKQELAAWALSRAEGWRDWAMESDALALHYWLSRLLTTYGAEDDWITDMVRRNRNNNRPNMTVTALEVFGGRAAIRETLQTDVLNPDNAGSTEASESSTTLSKLPKVSVRSHPFEKMWQELETEPLSGTLLDWAPQDQLAIYFQDVELAASLVKRGAAYFQNLGAGFQNSAFHHHVIDKTMARLGLKKEWAELFLNPNVIEEMLWLTGDLFFTEGADLTVVIRPSSSPALRALRNLILSQSSDNDEPTLEVQSLMGNSKAFWLIEDEVWILSTNRKTLTEVNQLRKTQGAGGLGRSSEFQYLQNRLPMNESTGAYVYFSDTFIRSLIGPKIKIAQWRRTQARVQMEKLTYAAMMYQMDHGKAPESIEELKSKKYLSASLDTSQIRWTAGQAPSHLHYGALNSMTPVSTIEIESVSSAEARAYSRYVENYTRYWSRFFDPIAIRFNREEPANPESASAYSLETFILPLVENSLYNRVRETLVSKEDEIPLKVPLFRETPVVKMSMNFNENQWVNWIRDFMYEGLSRFTGRPPELYDEFGPGISIALHDTDPILALGSGDILGFLKNRVRGNNNDMVIISSLIAIFTRPTTVAIELKNPDRALEIMRRISTQHPGSRSSGDMMGRFYKMRGEDAWVFEWSFAGLVKLRFGIQIENGFLALKNLPWDSAGDIIGSEYSNLNAVHMESTPGAAVEQLPSLFTAAMDMERSATLDGSVYLETIQESLGAKTIEEAQQKHYEFFGFHPFHPGSGEWFMTADGQITSDHFGTISATTQPPYQDGFRSFGLLGSVTRLNLETQLEEEGLRARFYWETVTSDRSE